MDKMGNGESEIHLSMSPASNIHQLEFLQINILIVIILVEVKLVAGTAPSNPIVRLCAMPSPTICFYVGFLFVVSAILTHIRVKLPSNMSSTEKGTPWHPALLAFVEDAGAIEGQGGVDYRRNVMKRYEVSLLFRRMVVILTWTWGLGFIIAAIVSAVLIIVLSEDIGFDVGWGLPWAWSAFSSVLTVIFVRKSLDKQRAEWRAKGGASRQDSVA